jgi:hypothetical protein
LVDAYLLSRIDLRLHPDPVLHLKEEAERLCLSQELATLLEQSMRKQKGGKRRASFQNV